MRKKCISALVIASVFVVADPLISNARADIVDDVIVDYRLGLYDDAFNRMLHVADDNHPRALFWVGTMYQKGRGTAVDFERAKEFYRRAALLGNSDAQNNLGLMFKHGTGVQKDREKAFAWFSLAAANGNRIATNNRDRLEITQGGPQKDRAQDIIVQFRQDIQSYQPSVIEPDNDGGKKTAVANVRLKSDEGKTQSHKSNDSLSEHPPSFKTARTVKPRLPFIKDPKELPPVVPILTPIHETSFERTSPEARLRDTSSSSISVTATPEIENLPHDKGMRAVATNGAYTVQVGIFAEKISVQKIQTAAKQTGFKLREDRIFISNKPYSRLRHGNFININEAKYAANQINGLFKVESLIVRTIH